MFTNQIRRLVSARRRPRYLTLQVEGERVPARVVQPVRHAVRLQGLEPLEVHEAVVVGIACRISLPAPQVAVAVAAAATSAAAAARHTTPSKLARNAFSPFVEERWGQKQQAHTIGVVFLYSQKEKDGHVFSVLGQKPKIHQKSLSAVTRDSTVQQHRACMPWGYHASLTPQVSKATNRAQRKLLPSLYLSLTVRR